MLQDAARLVGLPQGTSSSGRGWAVAACSAGRSSSVSGLPGSTRRGAGDVVVVAPSAVRAAGLDTEGWLPPAAERLSRLSDLAAQRRARDPRSPVTPYGEADVLTLLAGRALRAQLAGLRG